MSNWWTSTKSPRDMFKPAYQTAEVEAYLRENVGVDAALLAADLRLQVGQVESTQRRLGLRTITGYVRKGTARWRGSVRAEA